MSQCQCRSKPPTMGQVNGTNSWTFSAVKSPWQLPCRIAVPPARGAQSRAMVPCSLSHPVHQIMRQSPRQSSVMRASLLGSPVMVRSWK